MTRSVGTNSIDVPLLSPMRRLSARELCSAALSLGRAAGGVLLLLAAAWLTHVVVCFKAGAWAFLVAGAVLFPIAIFHGIGVWLSAAPRADVSTLRAGLAA